MATTFQRRTPFGGLLEHHLRIGDTEFYVPPTAISVHRQMKNQRLQILRSRNSMTKESGYFNRVIDITLFFPDMDAINMELRPLLAQAKKCPFLPIINGYLNDTHKLDAVTIAGVTVQTTPGFPGTLQAQLQLYAFEPYAYIVDKEERTFDEMFNWELFRWYYSRNLDPQIGGNFHSYYEPLYEELDSSFKFRIADADQLQEMANWKNEKRKLIKDYVKEKKENFWGNEKREDKFNETYMELNSRAAFEYDLHYDDWDIPGLVLTDFSVGFENAITSVQLQHDESPTHQYMGSQDTIMMARFTAVDAEAVASLEALVRRSTYLIREYHKEVANGFLEFDHQLTRLFGVRNATIEDMQVNTVEGQPGVFHITLTMIAYNRMERKLNEVQWMSETAKWDIDRYEDQGFWSLFTSIWAPLLPGSNNPEDYETEDIWKNNMIYRWSKYIEDRPAFERMLNGLHLHAKGLADTQLSEDAVKQIIYDESIKEYLRASELYPDLELPTYGECKAAGFTVVNTNDGVFVEPDFFINYGDGTQFYEEILTSMEDEYSTVLRDGTGGEATMTGGKVEEVNDVTKKEQEKGKEDYEKASESKVDTTEIDKSLIDKGNLTQSEMEALIREKAQAAGINQNLPMAFAKAMDEELKQFYEEGTNAKQGKVVNHDDSSPVMMNKHFSFYKSTKGSVDGEYIGVMKVRPSYGNVNLLGKNIEFNVEAGINKMASLFTELSNLMMVKDGNGKSQYNDNNVFETFGLSKSNTLDGQKARFAGVLMMYLGFDKEYISLLKDKKQPPQKLTSTIKKILKQVTNDKQWSKEEITKKAKNLPIKDFKSAGTATAQKAAAAAAPEDNFDNTHKGMMHDMIRYDKRGRLVRAFPTFFLTLIDEGKYVSTVKLSDQFFNYKAVMDIMYTNSRKEASSTLVLELANIYNTLDDAEKGMDLTHTSYSEVLKTVTMPGAVARDAERSRTKNSEYYKSIMLRTGTRLHFRMGYGSNPMEMPTIMNGTITSIQNNGETLTVVAQDDGIELTNKIRADVNETTNGGFWTNKQEPTEIVDEILTDSQGFFKNMWAGLSNEEFNNHSLGIMHFGHQQEPQGWKQWESIFGGIGVGALAGATGGSFLGPIGTVLGGIGGGITGGLFKSVTFAKEERSMGEINMNIHQTTGLTHEEHDQWWNRVKDAFGIGQADEPGINISLYDKTPWDVLNICASIGDDHVVAVHPFGFRNTIFSGKTYFPIHYDYMVDGEEIKGTAVKPFRQFHAYDSMSSIIDNSIITTEENMKTVAVGVFMNDGEMDTTSPVYVDTNIWPEKQKVVNVDTTMNAQGIRLLENPIANIPGVNLVTNMLNKPFKWYFDEGVAIKMTARALSDYVRDMYDGYLTVMGDPSVKPFDQMWINDSHNSINGPADVKEVTQIMNHEMGYITMIKPDAVVVNSDQRSLTVGMAAMNIAGTALIRYGLRKKLATANYMGRTPILNAFWSALRTSFKPIFNAGSASKRFFDNLTGKRPKGEATLIEDGKNRKKNGAKAKDVARWTKNGLLDQLEKLTGEEKRGKFEDILKSSKRFGFETLNNMKLKEKASTVMNAGSKKMRNLAGGKLGLGKGAIVGAHAAAGPIGMVALAVEALVVHLISATVGEFLERWLFQRQACMIAPLTKSGLEYTAGINGHKGSVVGDPPDFWQKFLTNDFSALVLSMLGVDAFQYSKESREGLLTSSASKSSSLDMGAIATNLFAEFRREPQAIANLETLYNDDRKAALQQSSKRLELLASRETQVVYEEEQTSWDDWKSKIGGWFDGLWKKVTDLFGSIGGGTSCTPSGDISGGGKAKGLSSHFSVIGPKIDKEAQKQGIGHMAEIIKAKVMQESGGNYKKYPDVMQASESLGKPIGYIKDVDQSITQGVKYFKEKLDKSGGDVKLALQSYNYGGGFIDYVKKRGGKYTKELAWEFAEYMVKKMGRKISRIAPGYGDSSYVAHVLRYYTGDMPSGGCEESEGGSGAGSTDDYPKSTTAEARKKYRTSGAGLVDLKDYASKGGFKIHIVGGTSKVRKGTAETLIEARKLYGKSVTVTSGNRPGDPNWHGTGYAIDLDTPNTMRTIGGKMRFPNGAQKDDARKLTEACIKAGFRQVIFGDWDIVQEMNKKYGKGTMIYDPAGHWNHLHCSYPIGKK